MTSVVVDASALLILLIDPGHPGEQVAAALQESDLHAPDLLPYEVSNVLRRHRIAGRLSPTEAALAHQAMRRLPIELWPHEIIGDRTWDLTGSLTAYDAAYVALAERLDALLVTADARLVRACGYERVLLAGGSDQLSRNEARPAARGQPASCSSESISGSRRSRS